MDLTFITGTALFQGIREEELRLLLPCLQAREHMYQREEIILSAGNTVADIGLVLSGSVNIVLNFYWGSSHILGRVDQGSIFAENYAAIQGQELLCDVVAAEDTSVLFLNMNRLMTTCEKGCAFHQQLIRNMLRISARKNLGLSTRMMHIAPKTIRDRVLSYLSAQALENGSPHFRIPFDRRELAEYLGVDREDFHSFNVSEFPLLVEREGYLLARPSIGRTDADALTFAADLQTGEKVRLSYGDPQTIIQQALHTGQQVQAFGPEGILLISCIGRHFYVGEAEKLEIEWYRKIAPTAVCHTYGEFLRQGRNINTLTITFVAVAFCEDVGKRQERKRAVDSLANQDFQGHLSMVHRLAHFVTVSSQEQEALAA